MNSTVEIVEVGPRDGLQNEAKLIDAANKIALVNALSRCGFKRIEAASFVRPTLVPQMADSDVVLSSIDRPKGVLFSALTPNTKGYFAAKAACADQVAIFGSASEGFSKANTNASIAENLDRFRSVMDQAKDDGIPVRGYVSCITHCPYDGRVAPEQVALLAKKMLELGCFEISLGETLGRATPDEIAAVLECVLDEVPTEKLAGHFHDTSGRALQNVGVALDFGVRVFDASIAGLGGCPFAPGAAGNVATEKVAAFMAEKGFATGLDLMALERAAILAREVVAHAQG